MTGDLQGYRKSLPVPELRSEDTGSHFRHVPEVTSDAHRNSLPTISPWDQPKRSVHADQRPRSCVARRARGASDK